MRVKDAIQFPARVDAARVTAQPMLVVAMGIIAMVRQGAIGAQSVGMKIGNAVQETAQSARARGRLHSDHHTTNQHSAQSRCCVDSSLFLPSLGLF